jgi:8-oxo-dGTP diphosphatase
VDNISEENILLQGESIFHPGFSIDCVIFGFHNNQLKVLLLRMKNIEQWALPGGFVLKEENVDTAAIRVLQARTGLSDIFLRQFYLFGDATRSDKNLNSEVLKHREIETNNSHWFLQRFISVGYYALADFSKAIPRPDAISDACQWWDLQEVPVLIHDHNQILDKALETLRTQLNYQPIGYNLLPEKFTMPELQKLYETILGKELDRRNFQRKMLSYDILVRLKEVRKSGAAHKAPYLYSFDLIKYHKALKEGLSGGW